eukprot:COSAG02_NODE_269_length_26468_cov_4.489021_12_plen_71_part_00
MYRASGSSSAICVHARRERSARARPGRRGGPARAADNRILNAELQDTEYRFKMQNTLQKISLYGSMLSRR